jgi:hypothetical protein
VVFVVPHNTVPIADGGLATESAGACRVRPADIAEIAANVGHAF